MTTADTPFYVTGGNLGRDAPSYVERAADRELYDALSRGEFCYVLDSRQMGKSSLMVRTAARLRGEGVRFAALDLTALGQNLTPEQWYEGLLLLLGRALELEDELEEDWLAHERLSPLQRWMEALREVVLRDSDEGKVTSNEEDATTRHSSLVTRHSRLVIFIDEIDAVRSLPFSTDEFFAAIREWYNRRTQDPACKRLTFCLLGVATPSDLIQDTRTTPFNIGRRIELTDFTHAEAAPLAQGLVSNDGPLSGFLPRKGEGSECAQEDRKGQDGKQADESALPPFPFAFSLFSRFRGENAREVTGASQGLAAALLKRVLFWTGGHPYLTQRLCRAVAEVSTAPSDPKSRVDRLCEELFLSQSGREQDDNLVFVRERLLRALTPEGAAVDRAALLELYGRVRSSGRVLADQTDPLVEILRLSGIVRAAEGVPRVRNRIYARVFDRAWVTQNMPDAELRRQQAAFRRGVVRTTAIATVIVAAMAGLSFAAVTQARRADRQRRVADQQRHLAQEGQKTLRRYLYAARVKLAQQDWEEEGSTGTTMALLDGLRPEPGQDDLRGFEWRYLWLRCQGDAYATWNPAHGIVSTVSFSPDGRTLATAGISSEIKLWDVSGYPPKAGERARGMLRGHPGSIDELLIANGFVFSADGKLLASFGKNQSVRLWDVATRREIRHLAVKEVLCLCLSPDGRALATGSADRKVRLWDLRTWRLLATFPGHRSEVSAVAFSPDGSTLVSGSAEDGVRFWDLTTRRAAASLQGSITDVASVAFSPDGRTLATAGREGFDGAVKLWDVATRRESRAFWGHRGWVYCVRFSPDGKWLASGGDDHTIRIWDLASHRLVRALRGHRQAVNSVAFSPDGTTLASGSADRTVKLWRLTDRGDSTSVLRATSPVSMIAFSPDGGTLATAGEDSKVRLWDIALRRQVASLRIPRGLTFHMAFTPDGKLLATSIWLQPNRSVVKLWDVTTRRELSAIPTFTSLYPSMALSPDSRLLATVKDDQTVLVWDLVARRPRATIRVSKSPERIWGLAFAPDGKGLAVAIRELVDLWDIGTRHSTALFRGVPSEGPFRFSPDGKALATSNWSDTLKLWDWRTGQAIATLKRESPARMEIAFSPDSRSLAMTNGRNISLWDLRSQQEVASLKGHTSPVSGVAFSPDGNLLASGSADGTVRLWRAASFQETDPLRVVASGSDRTVRLQWQPVSYASAYNIYRASGAQAFGRSGVRAPEAANSNARTPERLNAFMRLNALPVAANSFVDQGPGLVNGQPQTYAVAPLYRGTAGRVLQGPMTRVQATPVAVPPGFQGCSIGEGRLSGSVLFSAGASLTQRDGGSGEIILRGSATDFTDIRENADEGYFLNQPVTGDFQATVQALSRPTGTNEWTQAGLMVRETLESGSRDAFLNITVGHGVHFGSRSPTNGFRLLLMLPDARLRLPIVLRLTRRGDRINAETSLDAGKSFQPAPEPVVFQTPLAKTLYVGLATCSGDKQISQARFRRLEITQR